MNNTYLGVDIGGTAVKLGLITGDGNLLFTHTSPVNFDKYKTPIMKTVLREIDCFLSKNKLVSSDLLGIGVSATGQIDPKSGIVTGSAGHISNWLLTPVKDLLENRYHLPVSVANDANCAIIGEHWKGCAIGFSDIIMITIGTGIGGGIICNGRLLSGHTGIAGELGHFSIQKDGTMCSCGNIGCYEQYASASALVKAVREALPSFHSYSKTDPDQINGKFIFDQVKAGNIEYQRVVDNWIDNIAMGLTGLIHIFNPELVVIGGGISQQEELLIVPLRERVLSKIMPGFRRDLQFRSAKLDNNAGLIGAVRNLIEKGAA